MRAFLWNYYLNPQLLELGVFHLKLTQRALFLPQSPSEYCTPYKYDSNNKPIVPCGSIANSIFNGMFENVMILQCLVVLSK